MRSRSLPMLWAKLSHVEKFPGFAQARRRLQPTVPADCRRQGGNNHQFAAVRYGKLGRYRIAAFIFRIYKFLSPVGSSAGYLEPPLTSQLKLQADDLIPSKSCPQMDGPLPP
jgi:hypothetical protein